jgi:hypothetical protein
MHQRRASILSTTYTAQFRDFEFCDGAKNGLENDARSRRDKSAQICDGGSGYKPYPRLAAFQTRTVHLLHFVTPSEVSLCNSCNS